MTPNARRTTDSIVTLTRLRRPGVVFVSDATAAVRLRLMETASNAFPGDCARTPDTVAATATTNTAIRRSTACETNLGSYGLAKEPTGVVRLLPVLLLP